MYKPLRYIPLLLFLLANPLFASSGDSSPEQRRQQANQALQQALQIKPPSEQELRKLLQEEQFTRLEAILSEIEKKYQIDVNYESAYTKAYFVFNKKGGGKPSFKVFPENTEKNSLMPYLDKWVENSPTSHAAYCARGIYKVSLAWEYRGTKSVQETPKENLLEMHRQMQDAKQDLQRAIKLYPALVPAYIELIDIAKNTEGLEEAKRWFQQAIQADPRTYYVRVGYMLALEPRWLGSLEQMEAFAQESAQYASVNPRVWTFQGEVYVYQAQLLKSVIQKKQISQQQRQKELQAVTALYKKALEYGDRVTWLQELINLQIEMQDYQTATDNINQCLVYVPDDGKMRMFKQLVECRISGQKDCTSFSVGPTETPPKRKLTEHIPIEIKSEALSTPGSEIIEEGLEVRIIRKQEMQGVE